MNVPTHTFQCIHITQKKARANSVCIIFVLKNYTCQLYTDEPRYNKTEGVPRFALYNQYFVIAAAAIYCKYALH